MTHSIITEVCVNCAASPFSTYYFTHSPPLSKVPESLRRALGLGSDANSVTRSLSPDFALKSIMKFFGRLINWSSFVGVVVAVATISLLQADPTDDFSFSLAHAPRVDAYHLISTQRVSDVFSDNLDLFPQSQTTKLARHLLRLCHKHRFDPAFILSLIQVESDFRVKIVSPAGAVGLMQLMPATALMVARSGEVALPGILGLPQEGPEVLKAMERILTDPFVNLTLGIAYLSHLREQYEGLSSYFLLAAYNVGPAKLNELRARPSFKPTQTKRYYEAIKRGVPEMRAYRKVSVVKVPRRPRV